MLSIIDYQKNWNQDYSEEDHTSYNDYYKKMFQM